MRKKEKNHVGRAQRNLWKILRRIVRMQMILINRVFQKKKKKKKKKKKYRVKKIKRNLVLKFRMSKILIIHLKSQAELKVISKN